MNKRPIDNEDDDIIDEESDRLLEAIGKLQMEYESRTAIICPTKLKQMELCYAILKKLTKDYSDEVEIEYTPHEYFKSVGSIVVKGISLDFDDSKLFSKAIALSDNVCICALTNDKAELSLSFYGTTKPIE